MPPVNRTPSLDPPSAIERREAAKAAAALRAFVADPKTAGPRSVAHLLMSRPRRGVWLASYANLPGLTCDLGSGEYTHTLLPGWTYTAAEMRSEMIDDLDALAQHGWRPLVATRGKPCDLRQGALALHPTKGHHDEPQ